MRQRTTPNMPIYKRRRIAPKRAKRAKRSYAMVPRPLLNGEVSHRHICTMSSSTVQALSIGIPATGLPVFSTGTSTSPNLSLAFSLAQTTIFLGGLSALVVPNPSVAELQNLYDTFQIEKVEITLWSGNTMSLVSGEPLSGHQWVCPLIGHCPDTDDAANTSLTQLQQYSTFKCDQLGQRPLKAIVVPCVAASLAGTSSFSRLQKQDVNTAVPATPHYGYKMAVDGLKSIPNGTNCLLSMQFRIHYLMKSTR